MSNISDEFRRIVDDGNVKAVRVALKNHLLIGATDDFDELLAYARERMNGLIQPHDGGSFTYDESKWDSDYLAGLCVDLVDNFSDDRIRHAKSVVNGRIRAFDANVIEGDARSRSVRSDPHSNRRVVEEAVIEDDARSRSVRSDPHLNRRVVEETVIEDNARSRSVRSDPHSNRRVVEEAVIEDDARSRSVRSNQHSNRRVVKETVIDDDVQNQSGSSAQSMKRRGHRRFDVYAFMNVAAAVAAVAVIYVMYKSSKKDFFSSL